MKNIYVKIAVLSIASLSLFFVFNQVNTNDEIHSIPITEVNARLADGVRLFNKDEFNRALTRFEDYPDDGPLNDFAKLLTAKTYYELDGLDEARRTLESIETGENSVVLPGEKYLLLAKIYLNQEKLEEACRAAETGLANALTPRERSPILEVQMELARRREDYPRALEKGVALANNLELRYIGTKRDWLLGNISDFHQKLGPTDEVDPVSLYEFSEILSLFGEYVKSRSVLIRNLDRWPEDYRDDVYFDIGWLSGFRLDRPTEALVTFNRLLREEKSPALSAKLEYYKALTKNKLDSSYDLTDRLIEISREYPGTYFGKLSISKAVDRLTSDASLSEMDTILERYRPLMTESSVRGLTWQLFFRAYSDGHYTTCKSYLGSLESYYKEGSPVIEYYRYKLYLESDVGSPNRLTLLNAVKSNPFNYYSSLAIDNGWTGSSFSFSEIWSDGKLDLIEHENSLVEEDLQGSAAGHLTTAIRLKNHGLYRPALIRLERVKEEIDAKDYLIVKFSWEELAGNHRKSIKAATTLLTSYYNEINRPPLEVVKAGYPVYYREKIEKYAAEFGISPAVVLGLIRQESVFNPDAYSVSGARGLTQVMPATARGIASDLNIEDFTVNDLFNVDVSLRFGTYYIANKVKSEGDVRLGLTAYHGGSGNLRDWKNAYSTSDVDVFHEQIPRYSTSNYVERVYRNYSVYEKLLGAEFTQ
ncbi:MAG: transglycosylase SLT domain-containing protein [Candidatus Acetothermia bacterium]